jgi:beta-xylosidase
MISLHSRRLAALLLAIVFTGSLAACGAEDNGDLPGASPAAGTNGELPERTEAPPPDGTPGASPDDDPAGEPGEAGDGEFVNPVIDANFADPHLIEVDGTWYAYATGNLTFNIQVSESDDLVNWSRPREALPRLPFWQPSAKGLTWAPEVIETSAGFVMHYTARHVESGRQCLSVAIAESPEGPFVDESDEPFLCQIDLGGSIDSNPFEDEDGTLWLAWKNDGNCCGIPTHFYMQAMTDDGTDVEGEIFDLGMRNDRPWERHVIEAPTIFRHEDTYYLFYSANDYGSADYAVGYATSDVVTGPYEQAEENPILVSAGQAAGPGHQTIVEDAAGDLWFVYHAWDADLIGDHQGGRRAMWIDRLVFEDGRPVVQGPTEEPQPAPATSP